MNMASRQKQIIEYSWKKSFLKQEHEQEKRLRILELSQRLRANTMVTEAIFI